MLNTNDQAQQSWADAAKVSKSLAALLLTRNQKLVLAESCTVGMAAATLGTVPGISTVFCGSAVTYRESTKTSWLNISPQLLARHTAESQAVTIAMAENVLALTDDADLAAAITGHLGPGIAEPLDGQVDIVVRSRTGSPSPSASHHRLRSKSRSARQLEAVKILFQQVIAHLDHNAR